MKVFLHGYGLLYAIPMQTHKDVDEYINQFATAQQKVLTKIRQTIKTVVPSAEEKISYGIPTFTLNGKNLVHFAGYDSHYALYPGAQAIADFKDKLTDYKISKGTVQFSPDKPVPYSLIRQIMLHVVSLQK